VAGYFSVTSICTPKQKSCGVTFFELLNLFCTVYNYSYMRYNSATGYTLITNLMH